MALFGSFDENIKLVEKEYGVAILNRGTQIKISGEPENVANAGKAVQGLLSLISRGEQLSDQNVRYVISLVKEGNEEKVKEIGSDCVCITAKGRPVKAKTLGQKAYIEAIRKNTITMSRRNGKNLSCSCNGGARLPQPGGQQDNPYPPRR